MGNLQIHSFNSNTTVVSRHNIKHKLLWLYFILPKLFQTIHNIDIWLLYNNYHITISFHRIVNYKQNIKLWTWKPYNNLIVCNTVATYVTIIIQHLKYITTSTPGHDGHRYTDRWRFTPMLREGMWRRNLWWSRSMCDEVWWVL